MDKKLLTFLILCVIPIGDIQRQPSGTKLGQNETGRKKGSYCMRKEKERREEGKDNREVKRIWV
jgi:hypothetical protein